MAKKRQGILAKVNELYESGVTEVGDIIDALKADGLIFSPASVKTQVGKLRRGTASPTPATGKGKRFRRVPKKSKPVDTPTGTISLVRYHWMQTTYSKNKNKGTQIESFGNVMCLRLPDSRKYCKIIPLKSWGLKIIKVPKVEEKYMTVFEEVASDKTLQQFRDFAQRMGCTISAGRYIGLPEGVRKYGVEETEGTEEEVA